MRDESGDVWTWAKQVLVLARHPIIIIVLWLWEKERVEGGNWNENSMTA